FRLAGELRRSPRADKDEKRVGFLRAALAVRPGSRIVLVWLADALKRRKDFPAEIATRKQLVLHHPNDHAHWLNLSDALTHRGDLEEAIAFTRETCRRVPNNLAPYSNLGYLLEKKGLAL